MTRKFTLIFLLICLFSSFVYAGNLAGNLKKGGRNETLADKLDRKNFIRHQLIQNIEDTQRMISAAEGYLANLSDIVQRIRELAVEAANLDYDKKYNKDLIDSVQQEYTLLKKDMKSTIQNCNFNNIPLLDNKNKNWPRKIYVTVSESSASESFDLPAMNFDLFKNMEFTQHDALKILNEADRIFDRISSERVKLGSYANVLDFRKNLLVKLTQGNEKSPAETARLIELRILKLATESSNGTLTDDDRALIQHEYDAMVAQLNSLQREFKVAVSLPYRSWNIKTRDSAEKLRLKLHDLLS